jgi:hypothetical protein
LGNSESIVLLSQSILIAVAGFFCYSFRVMGRKSGRIPLLHLNHGVIVISQSLFGFNRGYPIVDAPPVIAEKLIKIQILHIAVNVWQPLTRVNGAGGRFTKD